MSFQMVHPYLIGEKKYSCFKAQSALKTLRQASQQVGTQQGDNYLKK